MCGSAGGQTGRKTKRRWAHFRPARVEPRVGISASVSADIAAITVNRWGHGYAYGGDQLHPDPREPERPWEIARARCGNVAFAGSDAAWTPLTSAAIAEAHRAVQELVEAR